MEDPRPNLKLKLLRNRSIERTFRSVVTVLNLITLTVCARTATTPREELKKLSSAHTQIEFSMPRVFAKIAICLFTTNAREIH